MQDNYEILQVHPKADLETIHAAYVRLRQRYDPGLLEGAADELITLARSRRDDIERAYLVLADAERRAAYDAELAAQAAQAAGAGSPPAADTEPLDPRADELIDYRPLPPARGKERPRDFEAQPYLPAAQTSRRSGRQSRRAAPPWVMPAIIVGTVTFMVMLISLFNTVTSRPAPTTPQQGAQILGQPTTPPPTMTDAQLIEQFEGQVIAARQVVQQVPDNPNAWIELGNALYDSVQIVRERLPDSPAYIERLPRWIEAAEAYRKALELQPDNATVRSDLAGSLCYYGIGVNDPAYLVEGLSEARKAAEIDAENGRVLLNLGVCLAFQAPPQTQEALTRWQQLLNLPDADPRLTFQARQLIAQYGP